MHATQYTYGVMYGCLPIHYNNTLRKDGTKEKTFEDSHTRYWQGQEIHQQERCYSSEVNTSKFHVLFEGVRWSDVARNCTGWGGSGGGGGGGGGGYPVSYSS